MQQRIEKIRSWLADEAIPLWSARGMDWEKGGFVENLSFSGNRMDGSKRSMVQARQIYAFRTAAGLGICSSEAAAKMLESSTDFLLKFAIQPSHAAAYCVDRDGALLDATPILYTQAFVIFGLANAFALVPKTEYRKAALALLGYLKSERRVKGGGYTEVKEGGLQYQSNPHMHLFEASLSWLEISPAPEWRELADELFELCRTKFVDPSTGILAEHFDENWAPHRTDGKFVFEPGHQFEWAWLLKRYELLTGVSSRGMAERLFKTSEEHGIFRPRGTAYDEVWSDLLPKKRSARFWPQCERVKAAVALGDGEAADEAMDALLKYLETPVPGLWHDTWNEDGTFVEQPVKASSLYHIIGAMNEYVKHRALL